MTMERILKVTVLIFAAVAMVPLLSSCDKEEESKTYLMDGTIVLDCPRYVACGELLTLTTGGIQVPEDPDYLWYVYPMYKDSLKGNTVTIQFPDTSAEFRLSISAKHSGYYESYTSAEITSIDTSFFGSFYGTLPGDGVIFDDRDGQYYSYVTIGSLDWFSQNLAYTGSGVPYEKSPVTHSIFGRFYSWEEATCGEESRGLGCGPQGVCPPGWSIPTNEDWEDFGRAVCEDSTLTFYDDWVGSAEKTSANAYFLEEKMWPYNPDNGHSNETRWNAIPAGYSQSGHAAFEGFSKYGFWWSSSVRDNGQAYYRYQHSDVTGFPMASTFKNGIGASVRCVRLSQTQKQSL